MSHTFYHMPPLLGYEILTSPLACVPCFLTFMTGIKTVPPSYWHLGRLNGLIYLDSNKGQTNTSFQSEG